MNEGERQVAPTKEGIRRDHVARYEFAAKILPKGCTVIDAACGVGYGTHILAKAGHQVMGMDIDDEALAYAKEHYWHKKASYLLHSLDGGLPNGVWSFDAAVCFETIEHLEDPRPLLKDFAKHSKRLIVSVPNEEVFPHGGQIMYHFRHYTTKEFVDLLEECGWKIVEAAGQDGPESDVEVYGVTHSMPKPRTLIAVCEHSELIELRDAVAKAASEVIEIKKAPKKVPKHVAILGLGPSLDGFVNYVKRLGNRKKYCDEVWGINTVGDVMQCDRVFHMDDVRIQQIRADAHPDGNIAAMLEWLKVHPGPVYTSRAHPDYPGLVEFPLEEVLNDLRFDYFNGTAAYAVAYAIFIKVKKISFWGCDFTYPNAHDAERGRACMEFWMGMAAARGIELSMPKNTTLMDAIHSREDRLYGYDTWEIKLTQDDGKISVHKMERKLLPTAEEIEARYDHSAHPNAIVEEELNGTAT